MDNGDLFYICGIALAVSAVVFSFVGLRAKGFPGRFGVAVALWFTALVVATSTFSVLHAEDEEHHKEAELHKASQEAEQAEQE